VPQVGIINPSEFAPASSIEVVIWTAVGGRATLAGPIIGAVLVNAGKSYFTGVLSDSWLYVLGGLFVAVTLFLPQGILGTAAKGWHAMQARRRAALEEKGVSPPDEKPPAPPIIAVRGAIAPSVAQFQAVPAE